MANNGIGVVGVANQARVMNLKVGSSVGDVNACAEAIMYAADNGADVINCSWGCLGKPSVLVQAVESAYCFHGCVIVAAAGNSDHNANRYCPANLKETITVSATNYSDQRATKSYRSNWGTIVDVGAPGGDDWDILSLRNWYVANPQGRFVGELYYAEDGTSAAAPHVAGAAALVLSYRPSFNPEQVRQAIRKSAVDLGQPGFDDFFGHGRLDACAALLDGNPCMALLIQPDDGEKFIRGENETITVRGIADGAGFSYWQTDYDVKTSNWFCRELDCGYDRKYWYYGGEMGTIYVSDLEQDGEYWIRLMAGRTAKRSMTSCRLLSLRND